MSVNFGLFTEANLSQNLNLAPQLLNWLKLLQVPTLELNQMIQSELQANPALEVCEPDCPVADPVSEEPIEMGLGDDCYEERLSMLADIDDEWRTADAVPRLSTPDQLQEQNSYMMDSLVRAPSLHEEIETSIGLSDMSLDDARLARELAGYLNERGYLEISVAEFAEISGISTNRAWSVLMDFQAIVPAGIGARDLTDCLIIQLAAMRCDTRLAERIVHDHLDLFAKNDPALLVEQLGVDAEELRIASDQIRMLDPDPGFAFRCVAVEYVKPDLAIWVEGGAVRVELCEDSTQPLRISSYCKRLLESKTGSRSDLNYIRRKLREASFIIQGITQRQDTMLKVAREIARVQQDYFMKPDGQLKPLTMNKVAAIIGVHETTISRAVANKFVQTSRGVIEMRAFFKVGYRCADGSSVTPEKIKEQLSELVAAEDCSAPLTDAGLSMIFKKRGVNVARRTIAKYREELGLPSSKVRAIRVAC